MTLDASESDIGVIAHDGIKTTPITIRRGVLDADLSEKKTVSKRLLNPTRFEQ